MATNYWGQLVKFFGHDGLELKDGTKIQATISDPSAGGGLEAPIGSFAIHNANWYKKTSGPDTGWIIVADQDAIDAVITLINDHIADATDAHDATAISSTNPLGVDVEAVLTALNNYKDAGLQGAYTEFRQITLSNGNNIKVLNDSGDANTFLATFTSNDESTAHFGIGKDKTLIGKEIQFNNVSTGAKISHTTAENITYTDSESTKLLKKENYELYFQDWKDALPSATFTSVSGTLAVTDSVGTEVQGTMATITQSSALASDSAEIVVALPTLKADWHLTPIKIQELLQVSGGAGTFGVSIQSSTDGIAFTEVGNIPELKTGLEPYKSILQLASNVTHVKIKYAVIVPDDATSLIVHRIHIASDAFAVGQTTIMDSVYWNGSLSAMDTLTGTLRFGAGVVEEKSLIIKYDNTTGRFNILKDCQLNASVALVMNTAAARFYMAVNGVRKIDSNDTPNLTGYSSVLSGNVSLKKGDYVTFNNGSNALNYILNALTMTATAYADNVIVDAAVNGNQTTPYTPSSFYSFGASTTSNLTYTRLGVSKFMKIEGTFISGTQSGVDYSFELPSGFTIDDNITAPTPNGSVTWDSARGSVQVYTSVNASQSKVEMYYHNDGTAYAKVTTGGPLPVSGATYYVSAIVPVNEYKVDSLPIQLDVSSERQNSLSSSGNDGRVITANTESIPFGTGTAGTTYKGWTYGADGSTGLTGNYYTPQKNGSVITLSGAIQFTSSGFRRVILLKNGILYKYLTFDISDIVYPFSYVSSEGEFSTSDKLAISSGGGTLSGSSVGHYLSIVETYAPKAFIAGQVALTQVAYLKDVKPSGTAGGTFTAGAWQTRTLNTIEGDNIVSLSASQFTLQVGKYLVEAEVPAHSVNRHLAKLYNITDATDGTIGQGSYTTNSVNGTTSSFIKGMVTLTSAKTFEIRHRCETAVASAGFGLQMSYGVSEVYTQVKITKLR